MKLFTDYQHTFQQKIKITKMSVSDWLDISKKDEYAYASPFKRLLKQIGPPTIIDTQTVGRLGIIFENKKIRVFESFNDFYGLEEVIDTIIKFIENANRGLEERKQILYLLGPVGGGKSSLAEKLKYLMEQEPIYVLAYNGVMFPTLESPLSLFNQTEAIQFKLDNHIPLLRFRGIKSPYLNIILKEIEGDLSKLEVWKFRPSQVERLGIAKTEPGDENNQDISTLVGKTALRKLKDYDQSHPFAYDYCGGLNRANQGILEFVEMFKAPIKVLHPLLTATQEGNYNPTEGFGSIPVETIVLAHSNEEEWDKFKNNKENEAFLDRINLIKVPYCLRMDDEKLIYDKMLRESSIHDAAICPQTLEILSKIAVASRLVEPKNSNLWVKLQVYNGEHMAQKSNQALNITRYRTEAINTNEGMVGLSTRQAFKYISSCLSHMADEYSANPIHMIKIVMDRLQQENISLYNVLHKLIEEYIIPEYIDQLGNDIFDSFLGFYDKIAQSKFNKYITYCDFWLREENFRDSETQEVYNREYLDNKLSELEKVGEIENPKDFRQEVFNFTLRHRAENKGANPRWDGYIKFKELIKKDVSKELNKLLPILTNRGGQSEEEVVKYNEFMENMKKKGYTQRQVAILSQYYQKRMGG